MFSSLVHVMLETRSEVDAANCLTVDCYRLQFAVGSKRFAKRVNKVHIVTHSYSHGITQATSTNLA